VTAPSRLRLSALVTAAERGMVHRCATMLARGLTAAARAEWVIEYAYPRTADAIAAGPGAIVTSLLPELARLDEPFGACEARLREMYRGLCGDPARPVYVCTILRHVGAETPRRAEILPRIRRLNLLAVRLSHELGVLVADIDRDLADIGARALQTDCHLGGADAARAAGKSLAMTLLLAGLDEVVPLELQEAARRMVKAAPVAPAVSPHRRRNLIGAFGQRRQNGRVSQVAIP
jgi:hypothetical protein